MMKAKKFSKKLALNKETISNLKNDEMKGVYGGIKYTMTRCPSCDTITCPTDPYP
jgi:hypothetical protein